jgi:hypothetical protein
MNTKNPGKCQVFKRFETLLFSVPAKTDKQIPLGYRLCRRAAVAGDNTLQRRLRGDFGLRQHQQRQRTALRGELRRFDNTNTGEETRKGERLPPLQACRSCG